jgi:succinate dehydrogenase / fumarate reductase membrane anchor subunit
MASKPTIRTVKTPANFDQVAWKWMRYSALLLIPLVWGHLILQDVVNGVHLMAVDPTQYVNARWADLGWRIYDALLLGFAFAHGVNGIRQVLKDYIHGQTARKVLNWGLLIFWLVLFLFGFIALVAYVV